MSEQNDATFISTVAENEKEQLSPRGTYVIPKGSDVPNETFNVDPKQPTNYKTVTMTYKGGVSAKVSGSSIMTEDDSDSDNGARKNKSKKDPKELFK